MTAVTDTATTPNVHEMVVIHRFFRRELTAIPRLVRATEAGDTQRAQIVGEHIDFVLGTLHIHHTSEDELLWPTLLERAAPSAELVHTMEAQHGQVETFVDQAVAAREAWVRDPNRETGERLAAIVDSLRSALVEHLDLEESAILPIVQRHLSVAEWNALAEHGKNATPRKQLPLTFAAFLEEADEQERADMLAQVPAPVRFFLRTAGARQYRRYITRVRGA